ncbi:thiamine phosphate synthase [Bacillus piscicola]|uniref:thiamine phosphate synthase n=1 Tax=Bacillus piscicola TaxID=1632684 RepID=UPI001F090FE6|nr:thiamine phosphate synthase [Bacillus piscicola]
MKASSLLLYFIMGSNNTSDDPAVVLEKALRGGITCFQFREKGTGALSGRAKEALGRELRDLCRLYKIPFFVNDDVELALRLQADGIHIGQDDEPLPVLKQRVPTSMAIGVSAKTITEAREAVDGGADYIGTGPMFQTSTKEDAESPVGPAAIRVLRKNRITLPIVGIGGINEDNAKDVIRAGADGVSLISAISRAADPDQAAKALKSQLTSL